jgi:hypothetical protein
MIFDETKKTIQYARAVASRFPDLLMAPGAAVL